MFKSLTAVLIGIGLITSASEAAEPTTVRGEVKSFHESPKGDVDGVTLKDGAEIRFPPHVGKQVQAVVAIGDEVSAKVEKHVTPKGDEHLRAEQITNVKSGKSVDCDVPPPDKKAKPEPKSEPAKKPRPYEAKGERRPEPPHEQILAEIRELRALVGGAPTKDEAPRAHREGPPHEQILAELRLLRAQLERKGSEKR